MCFADPTVSNANGFGPLSKFDIAVVLKHGASLLSAEEEQFDPGSVGRV